MRKIWQILRGVRDAISWIGLPTDAQALWNFFRRSIVPLLPTVAVIVLGQVRDAPFWQVALLAIFAFVVVYVLVIVSSEVLRRRRKPSPSRDEGENGRDASPAPPPTDLEEAKQLDIEELHKRFYAQPLQKISNAMFPSGERVPLDGMHYDHCTFQDCTFVYRGEKPFSLTHFEIRGNDHIIEAPTPGLQAYTRLLVALKYIRPEIELHKNLQPTRDVAEGFRLVKVTNAKQPGDEELKCRCIRLAEELTTFLDNREGYRDTDPGIFGGEHGDWPRQTMADYRDKFERRLVSLLDDLEQQGRITAHARAHLGLPTDDPRKIREMAARLSSMCSWD